LTNFSKIPNFDLLAIKITRETRKHPVTGEHSMKIKEKAVWFLLGMIPPIAVVGIFLLKQRIDSEAETREKYSIVPHIKVQPPATKPAGKLPGKKPGPDHSTTPPIQEKSKLVAAAKRKAAQQTTVKPPAQTDKTPPHSPPASQSPTKANSATSSAAVPSSAKAATTLHPAKQSKPGQRSQASITTAKSTAKSEGKSTAKPEGKSEPGPKPKPEPVSPPEPPTEYTLKPGDNPWIVAQKFGITTEELLKVNKHLNPTHLQIGQVLKLPENIHPFLLGGKTAAPDSAKKGPEKAGAEQTEPREESPDEDDYEWYVIKSGENPWTISRKLKVNHAEVMELNKDLNFRDLKIGQKIKVPKKK